MTGQFRIYAVVTLLALSANTAYAKGGRGGGGKSSSSGGRVSVRGYTKSDGTHVGAHSRNAPHSGGTTPHAVVVPRTSARTTFRGPSNSTGRRVSGSTSKGESSADADEANEQTSPPNNSSTVQPQPTDVQAPLAARKTPVESKTAPVIKAESNEVLAAQQLASVKELEEKAKEHQRTGESDAASREFNLVKKRIKELLKKYPGTAAAADAEDMLSRLP